MRWCRATSGKQWQERSVASAVTFKTLSPVVVGPVTSQDLVQFNEVENEMRAAAHITSADRNAIFGPPKRRRRFSGAANNFEGERRSTFSDNDVFLQDIGQ